MKSLETLGVMFVHPCVRASVTLFLGNRSLLFSETLQLVRACRCEKNVSGAFLIIFTVLTVFDQNGPFWPKMTKNGGFLDFFENHESEFPNFLLEA